MNSLASRGGETGISPKGCRTSAAKILTNQLNELVNGGLALSQITILSPSCHNESIVKLLPLQWQQAIQQLDSYAIRSFPLDSVSFARIPDFKGLENDAIIVVDIKKADLSGSLNFHYVAMSRARAYLSVIEKNWD